MRERRLKVIIAILFAWCFASCATVKPYQRAYLNDPEMQLTTKRSAQFEEYYESIREGSTTPDNGTSSDGCGCK